MEQLKGILFIDIETVPIAPDFSILSETMQAEWTRKSKFVKGSNDEIADPATLFGDRAGIFSEFAKVVCIGFGSLHEEGNTLKMRLKSLVNDDEKILLKEFCDVIGRFTNHYKDIRFCGHNIKEFDIPFLCRRMVINGLPLPSKRRGGITSPMRMPLRRTRALRQFRIFRGLRKQTPLHRPTAPDTRPHPA